MNYKNVKVILSKWFPFIGQGITINSRLCFVRFVYHKTYGVSIGQTTRIIQHELTHTEQIKKDGWLKFMILTLWNYLTKGLQSGYEVEANESEKKFNPEIADKLLKYCIVNEIKYYW